jgi:hypothetical protein
MKLRVLLAAMGLLVASAGMAQMGAPPAPQPGPTTAPGGAVPPVSNAGDTNTKKDGSKAPAADAKKAPAPTKKKEDPPAKIDGVAISRPNGGFLGLQVLNNNFVLTFYDAKKKKVAPDVARATFRWPVKYQPGPERTVLNPNGGFALTSAKDIRPPLTFKVFISLFVEGKEDAVESYTVDFHGE